MANIRDAVTYYDQAGMREDLSGLITGLFPDETPFLSSVLGNVPAKQYKHEWIEDSLVSVSDTLNGSITAGTLSIVVTNVDRWRIGDILRIGIENMWVSNLVVATSTATVTRGFGATSGASHTTGDAIKKIGTTILTGGDAVQALSTTKDRLFNYTQIFTDTVELDGRTEASSFVGGGERPYQTKKHMRELKRQMELGIIYGTLNQGAKAGPPSSSAGLIERITTNTRAAIGTLTRAALVNTDLLPLYDLGSRPNLIVCGSTVVGAIQTWAAATLQSNQGVTVYGTDVKKLITPIGSLTIIPNPQMAAGDAFILQSDLLKKAWLRRMATFPIAITGDAKKWMMLCDVAWEIRNENAHKYLSGITGGG